MTQSHAQSSPEQTDRHENHILPFRNSRATPWRWIDVRGLVLEVFEQLAPQLRARRIHVEIDVPAAQRVWADDQSLRRCVWHLALNAIEAMPSGGELAVMSYASPQKFELEISDSGRGLSEEFRRRLAQVQTTNFAGGIGQGLTTALYLAAEQGGEITARNCPQGGAAFTIRLANRAFGAVA